MGHAPSLLALAQKSVSGNCVVPLWAGAEAARRLARDRQHDPRAGTPPSQPPNSLVGTTSLPCAINSGHIVHEGNMCSNTAARALLIEECGICSRVECAWFVFYIYPRGRSSAPSLAGDHLVVVFVPLGAVGSESQVLRALARDCRRRRPLTPLCSYRCFITSSRRAPACVLQTMGGACSCAVARDRVRRVSRDGLRRCSSHSRRPSSGPHNRMRIAMIGPRVVLRSGGGVDRNLGPGR